MKKVAAAYGFDIGFDQQELTLLGGNVGLWGLKVTPKSGGEPVFRAGYIRGYISTIELLKGRLLVRRAEADGIDLALEHRADGHIPLLDMLLAATASPATPRPVQPGTRTLISPRHFKSRRSGSSMSARAFADAAVTPGLQATVSMDVRVSDLGSKLQPARFDVDIWSDQVLDSMRISGEGTSDKKR